MVEFKICHLTLSAEPEANEPLASRLELLFIIVPSDRVSNTKDCAVPEPVVTIEIPLPAEMEPVFVEAGLNVPLTTLVTNNVSPPLLK